MPNVVYQSAWWNPLLTSAIYNKWLALNSITIFHKNNETNEKFYRKVEFLMYNKWLILGLAKPQSSFETKTTPKTVDCYPGVNGHVTH